jgi:hypothetical protein
VHFELLYRLRWEDGRLTVDRRPALQRRPSDVRERLEMLKLKGLQASHPRIAGIVQTHRQQIDAAVSGRQQMSEENI